VDSAPDQITYFIAYASHLYHFVRLRLIRLFISLVIV